MPLSEVFAPITFATVVATTFAGALLGYVFLPEMRARTLFAPFVALVSGECFFGLLAAARWVDAASGWPRVVGYGILWVLFCALLYAGLRLRRRLDPKDQE